jgi:uncharacterized membrane protein YphA (DoxX/SURF4 family)
MNNALNIGLWIAQVGLAIAFAVHGLAMLRPQERMRERMDYIFALPPGLRRLIGVAELLAAVALILPGLVNVLPWLTPLAAVGLIVLMIGAIVFHIPRREYSYIVLNVFLLLAAAFVAYGRWSTLPV